MKFFPFSFQSSFFFSSFLFSCSNPHFLSHCWILLLCSSPSISPDLSGCCVNVSSCTQPLQMSFVVAPVQDIRSTVAQRLLIVLRRRGLIDGGIDRWRVLVLWYCGIFPEKPKTPTTRQLPWNRCGRSREAASRKSHPNSSCRLCWSCSKRRGKTGPSSSRTSQQQYSSAWDALVDNVEAGQDSDHTDPQIYSGNGRKGLDIVQKTRVQT